MSNVENLEDHMAYACKCGSVHFNLLKSSFIECSSCGLKLEQFWGSKQNKIEQQPIAWRWGAPKLKNGDFEWRYSLNQTRPDAIPLYTTPPQRTWVGLTDIDYAGLPLEQVGLVRWAEAKLKEKNT
jgi:hypothetical protein